MNRDTTLPHNLNFYGSSDYAVTADGGDYTVHGLFGLNGDDIWLVNGWYGQTTSDVWIEKKIDLMQRYKPAAWFGEAGVIQKAIEPALTKRMRERQAFCRLEWLPSIVDKPTRARAFQARASMGLVHLPDNDLGQWFLNQLLKFPAGKNDDAVDVCSQIGRAVDEMHPAILQPYQQGAVRPQDTYKTTHTPLGDDGWKTA